MSPVVGFPRYGIKPQCGTSVPATDRPCLRVPCLVLAVGRSRRSLNRAGDGLVPHGFLDERLPLAPNVPWEVKLALGIKEKFAVEVSTQFGSRAAGEQEFVCSDAVRSVATVECPCLAVVERDDGKGGRRLQVREGGWQDPASSDPAPFYGRSQHEFETSRADQATGGLEARVLGSVLVRTDRRARGVRPLSKFTLR